MRRLGLVGLAGVALGLTAEWVRFGWGDPRHWIPDLAVGWTFISCGLVASGRRPESRTGPLLAATGFTWFVWNFASVGVAAVAWVAGHLVYLYRGPLVQLVVAGLGGRGLSEEPSRSATRRRSSRRSGTARPPRSCPGCCSGSAREYVRAVGGPTGPAGRATGRCRTQPGACRNRSGSAAAALERFTRCSS